MTPKDPSAAAAILERTCQAGEGKRCAELGMLMLEGALPKPDTATAMGYIERGCELGRSDACQLAALLYGSGKQGVVRDGEKARTMFERGCAGNEANGAPCAKLKKELRL